MCKYILLGLLVLLVTLMVGSALVVQEYGWKGFLVLLAALAVLGYVARKLLPRLFLHLLTRPLRAMGAALRGSRVVVHSVTPCDPPPPEEYDDDDPEALEDDAESDDDGTGDDEVKETDEDEEPTGPFDWYLIEFTVVPPGEGSSEGRIVTRQAWTPQMIGAVGPRPPLDRMNPFRGWPPPGQFSADVRNTEPDVWTGSDYEPPGEAVYGEQRLRMRVGVTRAVRAITIVYAQFTDLGVVPLPIIDVSPGGG
jgi:hypothetical protein